MTRLNLLMSALVNSWLVGMRIGPSSPIQPSSRDLQIEIELRIEKPTLIFPFHLYVCILPPTLSDASNMVTLCPASLSSFAAVSPAIPAPTTSTSLRPTRPSLGRPRVRNLRNTF